VVVVIVAFVDEEEEQEGAWLLVPLEWAVLIEGVDIEVLGAVVGGEGLGAIWAP
jgi:hypothetical protein